MTDLTPQQLEGRLIANLDTIETLWPEMLALPAINPSGTRTGGALLPDESPSDADTPRNIRVVDTRHQVTNTLNGWARVLIDTHDITHGIPSGVDVPGLCNFLKRWAPRLAEHEAGKDAHHEINDARQKVERIARPERQHGLTLGPCPLAYPNPLTHTDQPCPGRLIADIDEDGWIVCNRCNTRATYTWWEAQILGTEERTDDHTVTVEDIVRLARKEFGQRITEDAVWKWSNRGQLAPVNPDTKPHRYRTRDVVALLMRRAG